MKLATLKDGSRDGQLAVVSRDLTQAHFAAGIATTMRQLLDDWNFLSPQLQDLYTTLNHGKARHAFAFNPQTAMAPLPRGGQCGLQPVGVDGPAAAPAQWSADPLLGPGDALWLPAAAVATPAADAASEPAWLAPGVAAITGDIEHGTSAAAALDGVRLLLLTTAVLLPQAGDAAPWPLALVCAPVALTPDELGPAWTDGRVQLELVLQADAPRAPAQAVALPGTRHTHLGALIAALARFRALRAGAVVGWRLPCPSEVAGVNGAADVALQRAFAAGADASVHVALREPSGGPAGEPFGALTLRLLASQPRA